jgi:hypothetical protein
MFHGIHHGFTQGRGARPMPASAIRQGGGNCLRSGDYPRNGQSPVIVFRQCGGRSSRENGQRAVLGTSASGSPGRVSSRVKEVHAG